MLKKIIVIDAILMSIFFLVNYLLLVLKIDFISSIYFIFIATWKTEIVFPFAIFSLIAIPFIKKYRLFYGILNAIIVYLIFWLIFLWVVSISIDKYGV
jgi:hypothetical protein